MKVMAYEYTGYAARICDVRSYFDENMKLLEDENLDALFSGNQIHTKIRDDNPTRYINGAKAKNVLVADGCVIEYVITDKNVTISVGKELYGTDSFQVYVAKYQTV